LQPGVICVFKKKNRCKKNETAIATKKNSCKKHTSKKMSMQKKPVQKEKAP
jgi:hypothetical protein